MPIRADNDPRYSRKFLFIGLFAVAYGLYFLYDGAIGYPARRAQGFEEFRSDNAKTLFADPTYKSIGLADFESQADAEHQHAWAEYSHERDIPSGPAVIMQYIMAALTGGIGLLLLSIPLRARGRWIEASDTGLTSSWGESFNFDQVERVNKRQWRGKGIAKVTYRDGNRKRKFVIDDYKFDRYLTDAILYELEQKIDVEKIVNGPPEPPPEEIPIDAPGPAAEHSATEPT